MITAIVIFFASVIGILLFTLILFSFLRRRQLRQRPNQHHFSSPSIIHTSSDSSGDSWAYTSYSDSSSSSDSSDSGWSSCSSGDSGGSSCASGDSGGSSCGGGGCGGGGGD